MTRSSRTPRKITPVYKNLNRYLPQNRRLFFFFLALAFGIFAAPHLYAHQQPTTVVLLDVNADDVAMELQIPLTELESAFGNEVSQNTETLVERLEPQLKNYLLAHVRPTTVNNQSWSVAVTSLKVENAEQTPSGAYQEITARLVLTPPAGADARNFILNYDVVLHQVVTHAAFVSLRSDWESGKTGGEPHALGVIAVDTRTAQISPLKINLEAGGAWQGFKGMVATGMHHISEGTDHLLFLLVLLLPAPLVSDGRRWGAFGGTKYSFGRLLKIVTAFTAGHSITLLAGALGWLRLPQQPVEILIAVSILISAIHAIRPIFPGREMFVAAGFGLIHGLAFATILTDLNLGAGQMALSILGFNVGIELMQLFVIAVTVPWLILIALTPVYKWVRTIGATLAAIAAVAWIAERVSGSPNSVGGFVQNIWQYAPFGILLLALIALAAFAARIIQNKNTPSKNGI